MEGLTIDFIDSLEAAETVEVVEQLLTNRSLFSRPRIHRERHDHFSRYDDRDFFIRYRLSKETVMYLLEKIEALLEYPDNRNQSVPPIIQLLCALRFFATGNHLLAVADHSGISIPTCSRIIKRVSEAIITLRNEFIKFPETQEQQEHEKREFYKIAKFPNVIGCIDCTHIKIQSPGGDDAELFRNRKGYMSINVQTISSSNLLITNIVARWPSSTHDSSIYQNSSIYLKFERGDFRGSWTLGDSGYPLKCHLQTPYISPTTAAQQRYNVAHIKTRNVVERQYGVLKRFPVLALGLRLKLETSTKVILACSILHNLCILQKEPEPINDGTIDNLETLITAGQIHTPIANI